MKKKMKKITPIWMAVIVIVIFAVAVLVVSLPRFGVSVYGDRLNGLSDVLPNDTTTSDIKSDIATDTSVKSVEYKQETRILNFMIDVNDGTSLDTAKGLANKIVTHLSEDQLKYFDIQVYFTCKDNADSADYPVVAYRHRGDTDFSFNKNNPIESSVTTQ